MCFFETLNEIENHGVLARKMQERLMAKGVHENEAELTAFKNMEFYIVKLMRLTLTLSAEENWKIRFNKLRLLCKRALSELKCEFPFCSFTIIPKITPVLGDLGIYF